jgi:hypothetical protein
MVRKNSPPTIEQRILTAIRRAGRSLTVTEMHGPGMPGLTSRRVTQIRECCEAMVDRGDLVRGLPRAMGRYRLRATYGLPYSQETVQVVRDGSRGKDLLRFETVEEMFEDFDAGYDT